MNIYLNLCKIFSHTSTTLRLKITPLQDFFFNLNIQLEFKIFKSLTLQFIKTNINLLCLLSIYIRLKYLQLKPNFFLINKLT